MILYKAYLPTMQAKTLPQILLRNLVSGQYIMGGQQYFKWNLKHLNTWAWCFVVTTTKFIATLLTHRFICRLVGILRFFTCNWNMHMYIVLFLSKYTKKPWHVKGVGTAMQGLKCSKRSQFSWSICSVYYCTCPSMKQVANYSVAQLHLVQK